MHNTRQTNDLPASLFPSTSPLTSTVRTAHSTTAKVQRAHPGRSSSQRLLLIAVTAFAILGSSGALLARITGWSGASDQQIASLLRDMTHVAATQDAASTRTVASPTPPASTDPYLSGKGTLLASDPLNRPALWQNATSGDWGGTCTFKDGTYHIIQAVGENRYFHCSARDIQADNFIYEAQMTILRGDCGGITFRFNTKTFSGYRFSICSNGTMRISAYANGSTYSILFDSPSAAIRPGLKQRNTIAVVAHNSDIDLYVNRQKITGVEDDTCSKGQFALFALDRDQSTEVSFSNVKIWQL